MNSPYEISKLCLEYGINKANRPKIKAFILSILGGFFIGASSCLSLICSYYYIGGKAQYYNGLVFPIGMAAIYCGGAELYMVNCLLIIPLFVRKITYIQMLLTWLISFIGNFIGSILISLLVVYGHIPNMFQVSLAQNIIINGINKCSLNFAEVFIQGLLCNFYICLGFWVSLGGKELSSIILGLWTPVFISAACDLQHSVANMFYITSALFSSYEYGLDNINLNWGKLFYKNLIPATLGNIVGGCLIGFTYYYIYLTYDKEKFPNININNDINSSNNKNNNNDNDINNIINDSQKNLHND